MCKREARILVACVLLFTVVTGAYVVCCPYPRTYAWICRVCDGIEARK